MINIRARFVVIRRITERSGILFEWTTRNPDRTRFAQPRLSLIHCTTSWHTRGAASFLSPATTITAEDIAFCFSTILTEEVGFTTSVSCHVLATSTRSSSLTSTVSVWIWVSSTKDQRRSSSAGSTASRFSTPVEMYECISSSTSLSDLNLT